MNKPVTLKELEDWCNTGHWPNHDFPYRVVDTLAIARSILRDIMINAPVGLPLFLKNDIKKFIEETKEESS